jgi:hypothetical protein
MFSKALNFSEASVVYSVPELMKEIELAFSILHLMWSFLLKYTIGKPNWISSRYISSRHIYWEVIQYMVIVALCKTLCNLQKSRPAVYLSGRYLLSKTNGSRNCQVLNNTESVPIHANPRHVMLRDV